MPRLFFALCLVSAVALAQQPKAGGPPPGMPPGMMKPDIGAAPTDLALHPNSPGYRLILNNVLFPAAKKKPLKT